MKSQRVENIILELIDQYQEPDRYNRPWIIGFSGGKDSTALLTLVWLALQRLKDKNIPLKRNVYVVCNDTMVENPVIEEYVTKVLDMIPDIVDKFTAPKEEMIDDDDAVDIAFPEETDDKQ